MFKRKGDKITNFMLALYLAATHGKRNWIVSRYLSMEHVSWRFFSGRNEAKPDQYCSSFRESAKGSHPFFFIELGA